MRNILNAMRFSMAGAVLGIGLMLAATWANLNLVQLNLRFLEGIERRKLDDILTGLTLVVAGIVIDGVLSRQKRRKRQQSEAEAQKLRVLKATMRTVHDIVNNFLNNLLLFDLSAGAAMPDDTVDSIESLIQETSQRLKALGDLESVQETTLAIGFGIEYGQSPPPLSRALNRVKNAKRD